jgi:hypothetical protein
MSRDAHMAFLNENLTSLLDGGLTAYRNYGRGLWMISDDPDLEGKEEEGSICIYVDDFSQLPDDSLTERLRGMVDAYDPNTQAVVLLRESDESMHAYTIGQRTKETLGLGKGKSHER